MEVGRVTRVMKIDNNVKFGRIFEFLMVEEQTMRWFRWIAVVKLLIQRKEVELWIWVKSRNPKSAGDRVHIFWNIWTKMANMTRTLVEDGNGQLLLESSWWRRYLGERRQIKVWRFGAKLFTGNVGPAPVVCLDYLITSSNRQLICQNCLFAKITNSLPFPIALKTNLWKSFAA